MKVQLREHNFKAWQYDAGDILDLSKCDCYKTASPKIRFFFKNQVHYLKIGDWVLQPKKGLIFFIPEESFDELYKVIE